MYDFTNESSRESTNAEKYKKRQELFGSEDLIPLWVADMDIATPDVVLKSVAKRLEHNIIGYEEFPSSAFLAQIEWMKMEHNVDFSLEDMFYSHSVVASIYTAIEAFTQKGEEVIVQTPVYAPFFQSVLDLERKLIENPLRVNENGLYCFDIQNLTRQITPKTKLLILCSPHNPVGRVWREEELQEILNICLEHNIIVFSDEVHCDLVYEPYKHIPFASLNTQAKDITITAMGVGKSFNMSGFATSTLAIANKNLRERFEQVYKKRHFAQGSVLSHTAFESAYRDAKPWLKELKVHLYENYSALEKLCNNYSHLIQIIPIEATYLAWLNCSKMGLNNKELKSFFVQEARLGLTQGLFFSKQGSLHMRLNFAISKTQMREVIQRLDKALESFKK